jgi:hypothetical protein
VAEVRAPTTRQVELHPISVRISSNTTKDQDGGEGREDHALRDHRRPRAAVRDPAQGPAVQRHRQAAEEEGNLQADQRLVPSLRPARNGDLRRQADAERLPLATRAGISICVDDMLVPPQKHEIIAAAEKPRSRRSSSSTPRVW